MQRHWRPLPEALHYAAGRRRGDRHAAKDQLLPLYLPEENLLVQLALQIGNARLLLLQLLFLLRYNADRLQEAVVNHRHPGIELGLLSGEKLALLLDFLQLAVDRHPVRFLLCVPLESELIERSPRVGEELLHSLHVRRQLSLPLQCPLFARPLKLKRELQIVQPLLQLHCTLLRCRVLDLELMHQRLCVCVARRRPVLQQWPLAALLPRRQLREAHACHAVGLERALPHR
mmetsp:Transcript_22736/g.89913  ORF Transcript_22736/g.89913 Transcript_22736/m.89913 type:complete len:231 (+) Transcript_22736:761-1453(+)